jgi:hypothetical protein
MRTAPLEGDRISPSGPTLPDFPAPKSFFVTPRYRVRALVGDVLVMTHEWVSAASAEAAGEFLRRAYNYSEHVRFEAELVADQQGWRT